MKWYKKWNWTMIVTWVSIAVITFLIWRWLFKIVF